VDSDNDSDKCGPGPGAWASAGGRCPPASVPLCSCGAVSPPPRRGAPGARLLAASAASLRRAKQRFAGGSSCCAHRGDCSRLRAFIRFKSYGEGLCWWPALARLALGVGGWGWGKGVRWPSSPALLVVAAVSAGNCPADLRLLLFCKGPSRLLVAFGPAPLLEAVLCREGHNAKPAFESPLRSLASV
jgi:hypothetical protein